MLKSSKSLYWMYGYVVGLVVLSVLAHFFGMFNLAVGDAPTRSHIIMTILDSLLLVAVILRGRIAFFYTVGMFIYGVSSQTYWTIEAVVKHYDQPLLQGITATLCWAALIIVFVCRKFLLHPLFNQHALRQ